ncbi:hypothetical protein NH340_JMT08735 [Sarcoptes scabiei]|nr:hypothetical protein NH340_JMT08735 [Sarcoptes scabiei]
MQKIIFRITVGCEFVISLSFLLLFSIRCILFEYCFQKERTQKKIKKILNALNFWNVNIFYNFLLFDLTHLKNHRNLMDRKHSSIFDSYFDLSIDKMKEIHSKKSLCVES